MKLNKLLLTLCLVVFGLVFVSCDFGAKPEHTTHVDSNNDGICDECKVNLVLATPQVTVDETGLATWVAVENAVRYIYKLNGEEMATAKLQIQLADGDKLQVKCADNTPYKESAYSKEVVYTAPKTPGLPVNAEGFYLRDADILQDGTDTRYLVYTTNKTKTQEDNVIALVKGEKTDDGWVYGEQTIILEGSEEGWDQYLGSASLTKGTFVNGTETYNYCLAYQGSNNSDAKANQIGFAFAKEIAGPYVKLENPVITYNAQVYGANMVGCYAPSIVNYNKNSGVRLFYTLADAYGHYAYFADFDLSDLTHISCAKAMITNQGNLHSGDTETMFPNGDFAYDSVNKVFYAVKDYSPSPSTKPQFADEWELCHLAEDELYTTDAGMGWVSDGHYDCIDLECDRCYSGSILTDMYGHMLDGDIVIVYNICTASNDYMYTQRFVEKTITD